MFSPPPRPTRPPTGPVLFTKDEAELSMMAEFVSMPAKPPAGPLPVIWY